VILAATHPQVASAAVERLPDAAARAAALTEMGSSVESHYPARAETLFRLALRQARAVPNPQARTAAVIGAATGLAAYDFRTARAAMRVLPAPLPPDVVMILAARAAKRGPEAARQLIEKLPSGDPATVGHTGVRDAISLAQISAEPDLHRALAIAQQIPNPDLQAAALLVVAQRLSDAGARPRSE
jgi:plasmid stabilization system protein ParE